MFNFPRFLETEKISVGPYYFPSEDYNMTMCVTSYVNLRTYPYEPFHPLDARTTEPVCYTDLPATVDFDIVSYLQRKKIHLSFVNIARITLSMVLNTAYVNGISNSNLPDCLKFDIAILFDNSKGDGRMCVDLNIKETPQTCKGTTDFCYQLLAINLLVDLPVLVLSIISIILAYKRLKHANTLRKDINKYFTRKVKKKNREEGEEEKVTEKCIEKSKEESEGEEKEETENKLSLGEQFSTFCDLSDITVIIMSILATAGLLLKLILEYSGRSRSLAIFDDCAIILGTASFLSWISMVRYMNLKTDCNILIETIKIAVFPRIFYFMVCVAFLFLGFTFCGWLVLGPYNVKYENFSTTFQTLFALANGDDVYKTFSLVNSRDTMIWVYNQIFISIYVIVFLVVVLNVMIAIFIDGFEEVKKIYEKKQAGIPVNKIEEFLLQEPTVGKDGVALNRCSWNKRLGKKDQKKYKSLPVKKTKEFQSEKPSDENDGQSPNEHTCLISQRNSTE